MMKRFWLLVVLMTFHVILRAQAVLEGRVTGADTGEPLMIAPLVIYTADGKELGTNTDQTGHYRLKLKPGKYRITASYVGYEAQSREVVLHPQDHRTLDFALALSSSVTICPVILVEQRPFVVHKMDGEALRQEYLGQDVPYALQMAPSVVTTSDAGAGIGYTGLRIRGMDQTNINVTLNGIPLNDAESHQVYWVDLPDLPESTESVEIERGVGPSTNGPGAFGANVKVKTTRPRERAQTSLSSSIGSFGTRRIGLTMHTGKLGNHFSFLAHAGRIISDGYIDRASSGLSSYYISGAYDKGDSHWQLNVFSGHEITYQAWNGVPLSYVTDPAKRTYNPAGLDRPDMPHPDEVDNYRQTHYQLLYREEYQSRIFPQGLVFSGALFYTRGAGYYENYKAGAAVADYGLAPSLIGDSLITHTDLIRRKWLDNDFFGAALDVQLGLGYDHTLHLGTMTNSYEGRHFGRVIWAQITAPMPDYDYYHNTGNKLDNNLYGKLTSRWGKHWRSYLDLQWRAGVYDLAGTDDDQRHLALRTRYAFFNPKFGLTYKAGTNVVYASVAVAHREPNRTDYKAASDSSLPVPERLTDLEAGLRLRRNMWNLNLNAFYMRYKNQLVATGKLNNVGAYIRVNIPSSYRTGMEFQVQYRPANHLSLTGWGTLSSNKIRRFVEYVDNWDTGLQDSIVHEGTDLAFSPRMTGGIRGDFSFFARRFHISWRTKYVGAQYLDNTSNPHTRLAPYSFSDLLLSYKHQTKAVTAYLTAKLANVFNALYVSNGWAYRFRYSDSYDDPYVQHEQGNTYSMVGLYPQAGRHFLIGLRLEL